MSTEELKRKRERYAEYIIRCADTVTLLTPEEVTSIYQRACSGEFDDDFNNPDLDTE